MSLKSAQCLLCCVHVKNGRSLEFVFLHLGHWPGFTVWPPVTHSRLSGVCVIQSFQLDMSGTGCCHWVIQNSLCNGNLMEIRTPATLEVCPLLDVPEGSSTPALFSPCLQIGPKYLSRTPWYCMPGYGALPGCHSKSAVTEESTQGHAPFTLRVPRALSYQD